MIGGDRVLGLIPARGGSKGLPRKNILPVHGKPLIAWTIEAAAGSRYLDEVVVSSDDEEILAVAAAYGCDHALRLPAALASDEAGALEVALHALGQMGGFDLLVLLQPTSPLRIAADIDGALERLDAQAADSCVSVMAPDKSPYWSYRLDGDGRLQPLLDPRHADSRRQALPQVYVLNGALYVARTEWLRQGRRFMDERTLAYVMPRERSVDIDTALDLKIAAMLLQERYQ